MFGAIELPNLKPKFKRHYFYISGNNDLWGVDENEK